MEAVSSVARVDDVIALPCWQMPETTRLVFVVLTRFLVSTNLS